MQQSYPVHGYRRLVSAIGAERNTPAYLPDRPSIPRLPLISSWEGGSTGSSTSVGGSGTVVPMPSRLVSPSPDAVTLGGGHVVSELLGGGPSLAAGITAALVSRRVSAGPTMAAGNWTESSGCQPCLGVNVSAKARSIDRADGLVDGGLVF